MVEVRTPLMQYARDTVAGLAPAAVLALLTAMACAPDASSGAARAAPPAGYVVDSIQPPGEALRRLRAGVPQVDSLDGPRSRAELLTRFGAAVARRDTVALRALAVTRAEFAWLIYPESRISRPPYRQPPDVAWLMLRQASDAGLRKLLERAPQLTLRQATCPDTASAEGRLRTVSGCTIRVWSRGVVRDMRLFGRLVERDGRWKIVGYDGDL